MEDEAIHKAMKECAQSGDWRAVLQVIPVVLFMMAHKHSAVLSDDEISILVAHIPGAIMLAMNSTGEIELSMSIKATLKKLELCIEMLLEIVIV